MAREPFTGFDFENLSGICSRFQQFCGHPHLCQDCKAFQEDMAREAMSVDGGEVANSELLELMSVQW
jgi:hypothetical protein